MPTYNGATFLRESIESALAQTFEKFELVIVDDASTDGTVDIAAEYARRDSRVRVHVNERHLGLAPNWNRSVELSRTTWVKFLFQDDLLDPPCLECMLGVAGHDLRFVTCRRKMIVDEGLPERLRHQYLEHAQTLETRRDAWQSFTPPDAFAERLVDYPLDNFIGEPTSTLIDRGAFLESGGFHPYLIQLIDWECWARLGLHNGVAFVDESLATFRFHGRSSTAAHMQTRPYRKDVIDPLIVLHEMAYGSEYEAVRDAACHRVPPVDLVSRFQSTAERARARASTEAADPECSGEPRIEWEEAAKRYPHLCLT